MKTIKTDKDGFQLGICRKCKKPCERRASWCRKCLNAAKSRKTRERKAAQLAYKTKGRAEYLERRLEAGEILHPDTPVFYDNYKEPLKPIEGGYGYYGVVLTNKERTHVQCNICGYFFMSMSNHLKTHGTNARKYKEEYGLAFSTALIGEGVRDLMIKNKETTNKGQEGLLPGLKAYYQDVKAGLKPAPAQVKRQKSHWSLERQNEAGLCPDQTLEKLTSLIKELGRVPSQDEFKRYYKHRYMSTIRYHFGSWLNYVKQAGEIPVHDMVINATTPEQLIGYLKDFYKEHGRVPMNSDFKRGIMVSRYQYFKHFGTLNHARIAAGLPAVVPVPGHKYILIPPEKFDEYEQAKEETPSKRERARLKVMDKILGDQTSLEPI